VVSGHLDSWDLGTGAIDDGAGVVAAMQTLQILKQLGLRPKRTIRMIAWMNEENGVVGGRTYAANHATQVLNHVAMIESDRGADHPMGFEIKGSPEILPLLMQVSNVLRSQGAGLLKIVDDSESTFLRWQKRACRRLVYGRITGLTSITIIPPRILSIKWIQNYLPKIVPQWP